ncbi:MAG TPA: SDR family oxidoreductase [Crenalkalicoccus sp.]|jgi:3-oxoacyl-[acyl-carrier protein] reductase|nr:SDR family oxidoreductase [Crenalkalicoccus sp.]
MEDIAIVTGGLRGLGRAMVLGLLRTGRRVVALGHIESDVPEMRAAAGEGAERLLCLVADLTQPAECDRLIAETERRFGPPGILVNNAGLTFTYIDPDRFTQGPRKFWTLPDEVVQKVMDINYVAADRLARRVAPIMLREGWGRIVNVTTKLSTMNMVGSTPYGPSKAALEMASEIWARELRDTPVTVNLVNPGAGANTPGMSEVMREWSATGRAPRLVEPEEMVPPLLFVCSREADGVSGYRFDANAWDASLPPAEAARRIARPAGFLLYPPRDPYTEPEHGA